MGLFSKTPKQAAPNVVAPKLSYPIDVSYWADHYEAISQLIKESDLDLNELKCAEYFNCRLVPEPDNPHDPLAVKVYAAPKGRGKTYYDIGYISSDVNEEIRPDIKKVVAKTHYWSLRASFDVRFGLEFKVYLRESKFT